MAAWMLARFARGERSRTSANRDERSDDERDDPTSHATPNGSIYLFSGMAPHGFPLGLLVRITPTNVSRMTNVPMADRDRCETVSVAGHTVDQWTPTSWRALAADGACSSHGREGNGCVDSGAIRRRARERACSSAGAAACTPSG